MSPRKVDKWIGSSPDARVPDRVKIRILERYGYRCYLSGKEIRPGDKWEVEHVQAIILGGVHAESNLAPALPDYHKMKTASEMKVKSKIARIAKKAFLGKKKSSLSHPTLKRKMDGTVVKRDTGERV